MANELQHQSVGTELTQSEFESVTLHAANNQVRGDILISNTGATGFIRLPKGAANTELRMNANDPEWRAPAATDAELTTLTDGSDADALHTHPSGAPLIIHKTVDETLTTDTNLQADDDFVFAIGANETMFGKIYLKVSQAAAADFKFTLSTPASPTSVAYSATAAGSTGADVQGTPGWRQAEDLLIQMLGAETIMNITIEFVVENAGNAGNVTLNWAQATSSGTTTVEAGSWGIAFIV